MQCLEESADRSGANRAGYDIFLRFVPGKEK